MVCVITSNSKLTPSAHHGSFQVKFINAVITGAFFDGANLEGATFEDALIGGEDVKRLCASLLFLRQASVSVPGLRRRHGEGCLPGARTQYLCVMVPSEACEWLLSDGMEALCM